MTSFLKPCMKTYSTEEICEVIGPVQAQYVELQLRIQQIENPNPQPGSAKLDKIEKVIMVAEAQKPHIYRIDNIA